MARFQMNERVVLKKVTGPLEGKQGTIKGTALQLDVIGYEDHVYIVELDEPVWSTELETYVVHRAIPYMCLESV